MNEPQKLTDPATGQTSFDVSAYFDANPALKKRLFQFMSLYDAAAVLDELEPPHGDTAAEFLREIGSHLMREVGLGDEFIAAMIKARPPSLAEADRASH